MTLLPDHPRHTHAVVIGAGTMGADVAVVLARGGCRVTVTDPSPERRAELAPRMLEALAALSLAHRAANIQAVAGLSDVAWADVALVIECIAENLSAKQALFAELVQLAPAHTVLTSNSSSSPISAIGQGLPGQARRLGLHFFMPAHLVPLVEVVMGPQTDEATAQRLISFMRGCASVPVLVRKDKPGFLANRLQHALAREAFAMMDEGVALLADELPPLDRSF